MLDARQGEALFTGPGEARAAARGVDWASTRLGPVAGWAESLRAAVRLCLESRTPIAIWAAPDLTLLYNDAYAPILLDRHPWAMGRPAQEVWADAWPIIAAEVRDALEHGTTPRHEDAPFRLLRNGRIEEAFFVYTYAPIREPDGRIVGLFNIAEETTRVVRARTETEARLEQERARLQAIIDTIPVGFFIVEASGKVVLTNDEAKRIWAGSVPLERVDEYGAYVGYFPETGARLEPGDWPAGQALLHGRSTKEQVVDIERFDGSRGTIVLSGAPIRDEQGRTSGAVVALQDISELRAAQARLEEADRRKDHFLAVLSHELRNPLTPVKNSLYILDRVPPAGDAARRAREVIARQIDQLTHLVDDLLDVTRIARGKIQLQRRRLELNDLVRRTVEDHGTLFENAGIALTLEAAAADVYVNADWNRVAQVVGNLLQNAAKFTPRGGAVRVSIASDARARQAVVRVADTGAGMAPEVLARLFEPFVQADRTLDRSQGGLGLGLALVKGLVEQHGGTIEARSDGAGKGAELTVRLPLDLAGSAEARRDGVAAASVRRRVLVIEDNVDAAETLRDALALAGHEVAVAHDGLEGLARARAFRPEYVLCDIGLPGMDGYEVARAFRADEALRGVHLVALSGYALPDDVQRAADAGFERHVAKPPRLDALAEVLGARPPR